MKKRFLPLLLLPSLGVSAFASPLGIWASEELPTSASVGDSISIPSKTLTYDGESKSADILITSPSGASYSGSKLSITEPGVYQVTYRAYFGSHEEKETHTIRVDYRAQDLFKANDYASASSGSFSYDPSFKGVKATFKNNGVLTYVKPVDITKFSKESPLVSFIIDPSAIGTADFSTFNITLTDVYDSSNYVTINCVDSGTTNTYGEGMYVKAGANGQTLYGYERDNHRHSDPSFGSAIRCSFRGITLSGNYHQASFYYDYPNQDVYGYPNYEASPAMRKIVGLNSKADHPTDPFGGFSKGLAYLSFEAKNFSSGSGDVVFTSIAGESLDGGSYSDKEAPEIKVDLAGNASIPDAVKGRKYKIFEASSFDSFDGDVETDTKVYYLPTDGKKIDVETEEGYFTPLHVGDYQIVYKAKDRFLNGSEIKLSLYCGKNSNELLGVLPEKKMEGEVYSSLSLPSLDDFSVSGGSGVITKSRFIIDPSGNLASCPLDQFTPTEVGVYTVRYQAFDYLGQAAIGNLKITVRNLASPIFLNEISLPVAFVKGEKASLPEAKAKMPGEKSPLDCPVEIYVNDEKISGNSFLPSGEVAKIAYVASSLKKEFTVPVVDLEQGAKQEKYLYGDGVSSISENEISFTSNEEGEVTFLRSLKSSSLLLKFLLPDMVAGEAMKVRMNNVSLTISKEENGYALASPSGLKTSLTLDNDGSIYLSYDNLTRKVSDASELAILPIEADDEGNAFAGFEEDITLSFALGKDRTVSVSKINNQTFGLRGRSSPLDEIGPELSLPEMPAVKQMLGASVTLPIVKAYDVLNEVASCELTLVKPDRSTVKLDPSVENVLTFEEYGSYRLEYMASDCKGNTSRTIRLFSVYEINKPTLSLTSSLKESYAPGEEIALPSYEVSDDSSSYVLAYILLTPDYERVMLLKDESGNLTYYLDMDDYSPYKVTSTSFKLSKEGDYTLLAVVRDQFYNVTAKEIKFNVKGAN